MFAKTVKFTISVGMALFAMSIVGCAQHPDLGTPPPHITKEQQIQQIQTDPSLSPAARADKLRIYGETPPPPPNISPTKH